MQVPVFSFSYSNTDFSVLRWPKGKYCLEKLGCVTVKENGTVKTIQEHIKNRKADDGILVIFPDAMDPIPLGKNIAPFKTGAFATGFDILPVVIKYKNYSSVQILE